MVTGTRTPQDEDFYNRTATSANDLLNGETNAQQASQDQRDAFEQEFGGSNYEQDAPTSGSAILAARNQEQTPWKNAVSGYAGDPTKRGRKLTANNMRAIVKKRGLWGLVATIILGGGAAGIIMTSPALLLVHVSEVLTNKFNTQLTSLTARTEKIRMAKINSAVNGTTAGFCGSAITINCRYTSLSSDEVDRFKAAGINVEGEDVTAIRGRLKPKSFTFTDSSGKTVPVSADKFMSTYNDNLEFQSAVNKTYNPKYAGFSDYVFKHVEDWLKISKRAPFKEGETDQERAASVTDETKNGTSDTSEKATTNDKNCTGSGCTAEEEANAANAANEIGTEAEQVAKSGTKLSTAVLEGATSAIKITGIADNACTVYGMITAVGDGAKMIRAAQMARFAMIFLTTASMIKAGTAQPGDVSYLNTILTTTTKTNPKSATDSYGYQYAAGMQTGPIDKPASQYLAGGGLGGDLSSVVANINQVLNGDPQGVCHVLKNPFVQGASLLAGVALMLIPGAQGVEVSKLALQGVEAAAMMTASTVLPAMLADMISGVLVDQNTVGEAAGNALTSGASNMMSTTAAAGGNAPLHPDQAVAYETDQNNILAQYAAQDRLAYSPLDPSNPNTFMGQVFTQLMPYGSKVASVSGILSAPLQMFGSSLSSLLPSSKADSASDYSQCQDFAYRSSGINLATDPFCNPIRGIPSQYLNEDPVDLNTRLINAHQIDPVTGNPVSGSQYATFVNNCINRQLPIGSTDDSFSDDGHECFIDDQSAVHTGASSGTHTSVSANAATGNVTVKTTDDNTPAGISRADYYVHYVDQRALTGMEGGYDAPDPNGNSVATTASTSSGTNNPGGSLKGDDYPYKNSVIDIPSPLGYLTRECVDFVTWRLNEQSGTTKEPFNQKFMGFGNAVDWRDRASAAGFKVDQTPKLGSVAWWGAGVWAGGFGAGDLGHVAIVSKKNSDGSIVIEQYNVAGAIQPDGSTSQYHAYSIATIPASDIKNLYFIHMADTE